MSLVPEQPGFRRGAALALALALSACLSINVSAGPEASTVKDAYIFTYPLVMNYRTMDMQAIKGDGQFGKWLHLGQSSPADTDIVTPNNDTPYSYAWVDLRAEPWVLTMPKIEWDRYYTSQWDDLWGYVLDNPGSVNDGNDGHNYLLAAPSWKGEVPAGIERVIRGESDFLGTLTRTQALGTDDGLSRVKEIQQGYKLQPLSQFLGTKAPPAAPQVDWPTWTEGDETREAYWGYVSFLLPFITPDPADAAMYEKLTSLGLKAGQPWQPEKLDPAVRAAMQQGLEDARAELERLGAGDFNPADFFGTRESTVAGRPRNSRFRGNKKALIKAFTIRSLDAPAFSETESL